MVLIVRKLLFAVLAATLLLFPTAGACAAAFPQIEAKCAVVMNLGGEIVYGKNEDLPCLIASTTKLMTALVALERADPDEELEIEPAWCGIEGSSMYLEPGQRRTVRQLLSGLLLVSGNDAAVALADCVAGSEEAFVALMNAKARELGMSKSHFANPHGLDDPEHFPPRRIWPG